jgi:hypothetical protein
MSEYGRWARLATVVAGGATLIGAGALTAGCSSSNREQAPSSTSRSAPAPSPTEKGVINMPPKAFNQNQNAADGMLALESQGYIVQINNGGNYTGQSVLSACKITDVDGLQGSSPPPNTTVYLTLSCPNSNN